MSLGEGVAWGGCRLGGVAWVLLREGVALGGGGLWFLVGSYQSCQERIRNASGWKGPVRNVSGWEGPVRNLSGTHQDSRVLSVPSGTHQDGRVLSGTCQERIRMVGSCQSCQEPVRTIRKSKSCQEASRILAPQQNADEGLYNSNSFIPFNPYTLVT